MTSAEIDAYRSKHGSESNDPLWEIALQLAKKNEREERGDRESVNRMLRKVGLEEMEIGAGLGDFSRPPEPTVIENVIAVQQPFPFVRSDGFRGGRQWWGVWYGPGPSSRSFPSKEAAEKHLADNPPMLPPPPAVRQNFTEPEPQARVRAKKELPKKSVKPRRRSNRRY